MLPGEQHGKLNCGVPCSGVLADSIGAIAEYLKLIFENSSISTTGTVISIEVRACTVINGGDRSGFVLVKKIAFAMWRPSYVVPQLFALATAKWIITRFISFDVYRSCMLVRTRESTHVSVLACSRSVLALNSKDLPSLIQQIHALVTHLNRELATTSASLPSSQSFNTVIESAHPYLPATVSGWDVDFPSDCNWITLVFDKRCATTSKANTFAVYAADSSTPIVEFYGPPASSTWPSAPITLPGNSFRFALEV